MFREERADGSRARNIFLFAKGEDVKHAIRRYLVFTSLTAILSFGISGALCSAGQPGGGAPPANVRFGQILISPDGHARIECEEGSPLCTDSIYPIGYEGKYVGHDEPALLFYSSENGSGFRTITYSLTLPKDPPTAPKQGGGGGTDNFMLHPAFWFGLAMCDTQSYPLFTNVCKPHTDANIFNNTDPLAPDFIGRHPGTAFLEMQFYPPGWVFTTATKWTAALNIDSLSSKPSTNQELNDKCKDRVGVEYVNFAYITKSGKPHAPPSPVKSNNATFTVNTSKDLLMDPGDKLTLTIADTLHGVKITIKDLTTGQSGSMIASAANGFGQVKFAPAPSTACTNIPYDFHPMYATSSESTRVPWAAHSYNVAFSDEIGHFDYCNDPFVETGGKCKTTESDKEKTDADDVQCFDKTLSLLYPISGCYGTNSGFDGVAYNKTWPGTNPNTAQDASVHPTPIEFSSPKFQSDVAGMTNYTRVAFETDLPILESPKKCHAGTTGAGCTNPPFTDDGHPAVFYPIFTTGTANDVCVWHVGGVSIPGTTNTFGGNSKSEFGPLLKLDYQDGNSTSATYTNFRNILNENPCPN